MCKKEPLREYASFEYPFSMLRGGINPNSFVNTNSHLLFSAEFREAFGNSFRTNRFITSSVFIDQDDVSLLENRKLFSDLELALNRTITLSEFPVVQLTPCFFRGDIAQVASGVLFRGLSSSSSSSYNP